MSITRIGRRFFAMAFIALTSVVVLACGGGDAGLGESCDESDDCDDGLFCSKGGELAGMCTAKCEYDSDCKTKFGDNAACLHDYCTHECTDSSDCPVGHCGDFYGTDYCVSE